MNERVFQQLAGNEPQEELRRRAEELHVLHEVGQVLQNAQSQEELLEQTLSVIAGLAELEVENKLGVFLVDDERKGLRLNQVHGDFTEGFFERNTWIPMGACLCGKAAVSGQFLFSDNCFSDARHEHCYPGMTAHGHYIIPIKNGGDVLGVMFLYTDPDVQPDTRRFKLLESIGGQIGIALGRLQAVDDLRKANVQLSRWAEKLEEEVENKTRDLKLAQAQVVRSEKLSSLGLLAAGVAHELNNPLTGILAFAHILSNKFPAGSPEKKDVDVIIRQTNRCSTIIHQLLDFSREHSTEKQFHDLHSIIEQAVALVEHQAFFHNIRIDRQFGRDVPLVPVDACQMQQVFLNLLVNAGEAMPDGGSLTIQTRVTADSSLSQSSANTAPDKVDVLFSDTGVGIAPEKMDKIFDPFFTSKEVGQGTGLGLAVSYGIIERHGGSIGVNSRLGKGTTFTVNLPAQRLDDETEGSEVSEGEERKDPGR